MKRSWFILLVTVAGAGLAFSLLLQRRAQAMIRHNDTSLLQQKREIERITVQNQRLSNGVQFDQTTGGNTGESDYTAELAELRAKATTLRAQEIQLSNKIWSSQLSDGVRMLATGNSNLLDHNKTLESTMAGGPAPTSGKLKDARVVAAALRKYASEHQGQFPATLDRAATYLPQPLTNNLAGGANGPVSGTNDFEIVFQGGTNDLGNIPSRRLALLREREPWLTPDGKWARTYAYADGSAEIVMSDDNFQSWDAVHVVPAPANP